MDIKVVTALATSIVLWKSACLRKLDRKPQTLVSVGSCLMFPIQQNFMAVRNGALHSGITCS